MAFLVWLEELSTAQKYQLVLERSMQTPCERTNPEEAIFLYDGECGFCNSIVMFLLDNSAANRLSFCPLQADFSRELCREHGIEEVDLSTAYFFDGTKMHMRSSAVLRAITLCNTPARYLAVGLFIPKLIRDQFYSVISRFRKHIPRLRKTGCRLLTANETARFLFR
jgi:predicted DCC family thiol-disulfide oxidoreductase YuxK